MTHTSNNPLRFDFCEFHFDAASEGGEGLCGFHASGEWNDGEANIDQFWPLPGAEAEEVRIARWGKGWESQQRNIRYVLEVQLTESWDRHCEREARS